MSTPGTDTYVLVAGSDGAPPYCTRKVNAIGDLRDMISRYLQRPECTLVAAFLLPTEGPMPRGPFIDMRLESGVWRDTCSAAYPRRIHPNTHNLGITEPPPTSTTL